MTGPGYERATMINHRTKSRGLTKRLFLRATIGVTVLASAVGLMAVPALAAENRCSSPDNVVRCLYIARNLNGTYYVEVGIDVPMSVQDAQAIIDQPGEPFVVTMVGSDPLADNNLFNVPRYALDATAEDGLRGRFSRDQIPRSLLNEDNSIVDQMDEVFARIVLTDLRNNSTRTFKTVIISQQF
jgi:hypothetical protein